MEESLTDEVVGNKLVVALGLCGLASGIVTCAFVYPDDHANGVSPGIIFGIFLIIPLALFRILSLLKAVVLAVYSFAIYCVAFCSAFAFQLIFRGLVPEADMWTMGHDERAAPTSLFIGGLIGGLVLFAAVMLVAGIRERRRAKALVGAVLGGVLGLVGWVLGVPLGLAVWYFLHIFHLTSPWGGGPQTCLGVGCGYTQLVHTYSMFIVWQTGVAVAVGTMLRSVTVATKNGGLASRSDLLSIIRS